MNTVPEPLVPVFAGETRFELEPRHRDAADAFARGEPISGSDRPARRIADVPWGRGIPFSALND